jgi:sec-independent protein translocase protein TatA
MLTFPGGFEWLIILVIILVLFGGKKLPELMGGLGKGIKSFKKGITDKDNDKLKCDKEDVQNKTNEPKDINE